MVFFFLKNHLNGLFGVSSSKKICIESFTNEWDQFARLIGYEDWLLFFYNLFNGLDDVWTDAEISAASWGDILLFRYLDKI